MKQIDFEEIEKMAAEMSLEEVEKYVMEQAMSFQGEAVVIDDDAAIDSWEIKKEQKLNKPMKSVEDVKWMAMKYYEKGGDVIIECWDDIFIEEWLAENDGCISIKHFKSTISALNELHSYEGGY